MKPQHLWLLALILLAQCVVAGARVRAAVADSPAATAVGTPAAPLAWKDLDPGQQQLLQSYSKDWDSLPVARQRALARGARRWQSMDAASRAAARERFQTWQSLPEERRELIRRRWERFQQLDPESKALVRQKFQAYMRLPAERRRQLRERWLSMTPEERARMLERMKERHPHRPPAP